MHRVEKVEIFSHPPTTTIVVCGQANSAPTFNQTQQTSAVWKLLEKYVDTPINFADDCVVRIAEIDSTPVLGPRTQKQITNSSSPFHFQFSEKTSTLFPHGPFFIPKTRDSIQSVLKFSWFEGPGPSPPAPNLDRNANRTGGPPPVSSRSRSEPL